MAKLCDGEMWKVEATRENCADRNFPFTIEFNVQRPRPVVVKLWLANPAPQPREAEKTSLFASWPMRHAERCVAGYPWAAQIRIEAGEIMSLTWGTAQPHIRLNIKQPSLNTYDQDTSCQLPSTPPPNNHLIPRRLSPYAADRPHQLAAISHPAHVSVLGARSRRSGRGLRQRERRK